MVFPLAMRAPDQSSKSTRETLEPLLDAVARGDRAAFKVLYEATSAKLFGLVLRILRQRDRAEDCLQDVYLRVWTHAGDFRPALGTPMTWMITIARNAALDRLRRSQRERLNDDLDVLADVPDPSPDADPVRTALVRIEGSALAQCLEALEHAQRDCIVLAYRDGCTHDELATRLDRPVGTVKSWIRRGLARLRECLGS